MKTFALALALAANPGSVTAGNSAAGDLVSTFATCAGRLSAQMYHQWLVSDGTADQTEMDRAAMIGLLEAATPDGAGREVLSNRTAARQAHSALLSRATFGPDDAHAAWARRRADREIALCRSLVLH